MIRREAPDGHLAKGGILSPGFTDTEIEDLGGRHSPGLCGHPALLIHVEEPDDRSHHLKPLRRPRADRAGATHPPADPAGGHDRRLPRRARSDGRGHRSAADRHRPARQRRLHMGVHRVSPHGHHQRSAVRQALRPLRPPTHLPPGHRHLPGRLGTGRPVTVHRVAHRGPSRPGARRWSALPDRDRHHRRHLRTVRAWQVSGPVRCRLRPLGPGGPGRGRSHHRYAGVALGLPRQPAGRCGGCPDGVALPAGLSLGR